MVKHDMVKERIALLKSYFSLFTSPLLALLTCFLVGVRGITEMLLLMAFFFLSTAFLNSYNNIVDAKSDALTKKGFPIPSGVITSKEALTFSLTLFVLSMFVTSFFVLINLLAGLTLFFDLLLVFFYSVPKVRLKRFPVLKGTVLVSHTLLIPFTVAAFLVGRAPLSYFTFVLPLFLMGLSIHTIQDVGDIEGDRLIGDKTIPLLIGVKNAVSVSIGLLLVAIAYLIFLDAEYKMAAALTLSLQAVILFLLLLDERRWKIVFWTNSATSFVAVTSLLYGCCT